MALKVARFFAVVLTALALTMTSAHVLELPQKLQYDPELYAAVNSSLYRYFAIVGGAYTVGSIVAAAVLTWLVRGRHPAFEWTVIGGTFLVAAFISWLAIVQKVNAEIGLAMSDAPGIVPFLWNELKYRWEYGHVIGFVLQLFGFLALVISTVVETTKVAPETGIVKTRVSGLIHAPSERVASIYENFAAWPQIFGKTIKGVRLLREDGPTKTIEVDHVEGRAMNVMSRIAPDEIRLEEWKKRYTARFTNRFEPVPGGTRYSIIANVSLTGPFKALAPIAKPFVRARIKRFVLYPVKDVAEHGGEKAWSR
jgi:hypothetical protein